MAAIFDLFIEHCLLLRHGAYLCFGHLARDSLVDIQKAGHSCVGSEGLARRWSPVVKWKSRQ